MTLHWWMHWFWITALLMLVGSGRAGAGVVTPAEEEPARGTEEAGTQPPPAPAPRPNERRGKATHPRGGEPAAAPPPSPAPAAEAPLSKLYRESLADRRALEKPLLFNASALEESGGENATEPAPTVVANATEAPASTAADNLTRQQLGAELAEGPARRHATERPRAPATVGGRRARPLDAGAVAGISFATLALATLAGASGFVLYRRRYLNRPQTLNDKCSNPDSSGYLDDTTVRENSEEMYSLDNDSFLNSLEAMTIQNYWTENVKHSKL